MENNECSRMIIAMGGKVDISFLHCIIKLFNLYKKMVNIIIMMYIMYY